MSIFNFLKDQPKPTSAIAERLDYSASKDQEKPSTETVSDVRVGRNFQEIPENVFIEYAKPKLKDSMEPIEAKSELNDLQSLYRYLEQNLERKGYEDALINPDTSYMEEHIQHLNTELSLLIAKIKTYYASHIRNVDFHIDTRKRNGMIETVDELESYRQTVIDDIKNVSVIEEDSNNGTGLSQNVIQSYRKGFRNGFAAITYNTVLGRKNN